MTAQGVSLRSLWRSYGRELSELPSPSNLVSILGRLLPLRVPIRDATVAASIFPSEGEDLQCSELTSVIDAFLASCDAKDAAPSSPDSWQEVYRRLLCIPVELCSANRHVMKIETPSKLSMDQMPQPDFQLLCDEMPVLRGVESSAFSDTELLRTLPGWSPPFYEALPYTLGVVTSGEKLAVYTVDRELHSTKIVEFASIFEQKAEVIKAFFNLAYVLSSMELTADRTYTSSRRFDGDRLIMEMNDRIRSTIRTADFERIAQVYKTLKELSDSDVAWTYLQTVKRLEVVDETQAITVELSPIGQTRCPGQEQEVLEWLRCMLTALKHWHGKNYCHGDVTWGNMVYVPSVKPFWVLTGMDKSSRPDKEVIRWPHPFRGVPLHFKHDLFQLGQLIDTCVDRRWPEKLEKIRATLVSALDMPDVTAEFVLAMVNEIAAS